MPTKGKQAYKARGQEELFGYGLEMDCPIPCRVGA